ncbi:Hypothetical protein NocV09_11200030 [Nannochloropsis oceanica]
MYGSASLYHRAGGPCQVGISARSTNEVSSRSKSSEAWEDERKGKTGGGGAGKGLSTLLSMGEGYGVHVQQQEPQKQSSLTAFQPQFYVQQRSQGHGQVGQALSNLSLYPPPVQHYSISSSQQHLHPPHALQLASNSSCFIRPPVRTTTTTTRTFLPLSSIVSHPSSSSSSSSSSSPTVPALPAASASGKRSRENDGGERGGGGGGGGGGKGAPNQGVWSAALRTEYRGWLQLNRGISKETSITYSHAVHGVLKELVVKRVREGRVGQPTHGMDVAQLQALIEEQAHEAERIIKRDKRSSYFRYLKEFMGMQEDDLNAFNVAALPSSSFQPFSYASSNTSTSSSASLPPTHTDEHHNASCSSFSSSPSLPPSSSPPTSIPSSVSSFLLQQQAGDETARAGTDTPLWSPALQQEYHRWLEGRREEGGWGLGEAPWEDVLTHVQMAHVLLRKVKEEGREGGREGSRGWGNRIQPYKTVGMTSPYGTTLKALIVRKPGLLARVIKGPRNRRFFQPVTTFFGLSPHPSSLSPPLVAPSLQPSHSSSSITSSSPSSSSSSSSSSVPVWSDELRCAYKRRLVMDLGCGESEVSSNMQSAVALLRSLLERRAARREGGRFSSLTRTEAAALLREEGGGGEGWSPSSFQMFLQSGMMNEDEQEEEEEEEEEGEEEVGETEKEEEEEEEMQAEREGPLHPHPSSSFVSASASSPSSLGCIKCSELQQERDMWAQRASALQCRVLELERTLRASCPPVSPPPSPASRNCSGVDSVSSSNSSNRKKKKRHFVSTLPPLGGEGRGRGGGGGGGGGRRGRGRGGRGEEGGERGGEGGGASNKMASLLSACQAVEAE